ncbi:MAG TPA: DUF1043 family protein [Wenzhouxiangella sp.]|nr:DUF1043 family protein [Wenzhouxiangella sp.]
MNILTAVIIGLSGGLVGVGVAWLVFARKTHEPTVAQLKAENEHFREEVNAHFVRTAQLMNELTDSYKKVFEHLSDGADRLVDEQAVRERMPQVGQQEVRLRHIGSPSARPATKAAADHEQSVSEQCDSTPGRDENDRAGRVD